CASSASRSFIITPAVKGCSSSWDVGIGVPSTPVGPVSDITLALELMIREGCEDPRKPLSRKGWCGNIGGSKEFRDAVVKTSIRHVVLSIAHKTAGIAVRRIAQGGRVARMRTCSRAPPFWRPFAAVGLALLMIGTIGT